MLQIIEAAASNMYERTFWIGLTDKRQEGRFRWTHLDSLTSYTKWNRGEPNNANSGEECVEVILPGGKWNDASCDLHRGVVCQYSDKKENNPAMKTSFWKAKLDELEE